MELGGISSTSRQKISLERSVPGGCASKDPRGLEPSAASLSCPETADSPITRLFYTLSTLFCRFSIAVFLLRLCVIRIHKIIIYGSMAMILAYSIFYFFLVLFQCWPVSYFWNGK
jgi:hypothetical protein